MKTLITVKEIKAAADSSEKVIYIDSDTIVTPAARDAADEWGVSLKQGVPPITTDTRSQEKEPKEIFEPNQKVQLEKINGGTITPEFVSQIVMQVMAQLSQFGKNTFDKQVDASGLCLVKGGTGTWERFDTGNPKDKVYIKELLSKAESPNLATGFMTLEQSTFNWHLRYEEMQYIIEGTLDITVNGKTYTANAGDVFYLPKNVDITFSASNKVKFFFVTYPANWAELSN